MHEYQTQTKPLIIQPLCMEWYMITKLQISLIEKCAMSKVPCNTKISLRKLHKNWDIKKE